jgi:hypothetical protein
MRRLWLVFACAVAAVSALAVGVDLALWGSGPSRMAAPAPASVVNANH